jgi:hypothetical protein
VPSGNIVAYRAADVSCDDPLTPEVGVSVGIEVDDCVGAGVGFSVSEPPLVGVRVSVEIEVDDCVGAGVGLLPTTNRSDNSAVTTIHSPCDPVLSTITIVRGMETHSNRP